MAHAGGRPAKYTKELADRVCFELSQGKSLRTVCKNDWCPEGVTIFKWMREMPEFLSQYEKAKQESADALAEEIMDIADTPMEGDEVTINADGSKVIKKGDMLGHRRLQIDSRKWIMSKMKPKKYGEKLDMTTGGEKLESVLVKFIDGKDHTDTTGVS